MREILLLLVASTTNVLCFFIGAKIGQMVSKGKEIEAPSVNPIKAVREHKEKKEAEMQQDRVNTIMRNIDRYDGTARGQEDVPRG